MKHIMLLHIIALLSALTALSNDSIPEEPWGIVNVSVAHVRTRPTHSAELSTQALLGTPIHLIEKANNEWYRIEMPDGYEGYMISNSLVLKSDAEMKQWRAAKRSIVISPSEIKAYSDSATHDCELIVSDLVPGDILETIPSQSTEYVNIKYPDGRTAWIARPEVTDFAQWAKMPYSADIILYYAYNCMGTPYLWGGTSIKGMDCSGLSKIAYWANGIILRRDASQQALTGTAIDTDSLEPGDLLFFGNRETGRVNHVGIYVSDGMFIEAAGRVRCNRMTDMPNYLFAKRIRNDIGKDGIIRTADHPWYFNLNNHE